MAKVPLSILGPIKNEAANLPRCLASVAWADEVFVVDSGSTDASEVIARQSGATLVQFQFNGTWPKKKNWALENLPFKHEWVFILDADEVLPADAEGEFNAIVSDARHPIFGYWINRRFMFMGRWLKHAYYPNWNLRLFKHRCGRYEKLTDIDTASGDNEVHEHVVVEGETERLRCEMDHYAFPSVDVFVEKHNRYSNWEARVALDRFLHKSGEQLQDKRVGLRRKLKQASQSLPCRALLRFLFVYVWQCGFLDGWEGFYFARLHGYYEFLSVAKTYELRRNATKMAGSIPRPAQKLELVNSFFLPLTFALTLIVVLYFALIPNLHGEMLRVLPKPFQRWCGMHDNLNNFLAFGVLGFLGFQLPRSSVENGVRRAKKNWWVEQCTKDVLRLTVLLAFVCSLEIAQIWIPGRDSSLRDVGTGSAGVLFAWTLSLALSRARMNLKR